MSSSKNHGIVFACNSMEGENVARSQSVALRAIDLCPGSFLKSKSHSLCSSFCFFLFTFFIFSFFSVPLWESFIFQVGFRFIQPPRLTGKTRVTHFQRKRSEEMQKTPQKGKRWRSQEKFVNCPFPLRTWTLRQASPSTRVHSPRSPSSWNGTGIPVWSSEKTN